jgi:hypothetical protein
MTDMPYLVLLTLLAGCAVQTETVYLRDQETGQSAQCGPYNAYETSTTMESAKKLRHCVADYRSQGFVTFPQP